MVPLKGIYLRFGDLNRLPFYIEGGLEMAAQFGGRSIIGDHVINMPNGLKDIIKVLFPRVAIQALLWESRQTYMEIM